MIKVTYYGDLARKTGAMVEYLEGESVSEILKAMKKRHGADVYKTAKRSHILVNGENAGLYGGYRMKIKEGDEVVIFPVCGGG